MRRREFLQGALGAASSLALGGSAAGCGGEEGPILDASGWRAGSVRHLLPTADHRRIRLKVLFRESEATSPRLVLATRSVVGLQTDTAGRFWSFDIAGLEAGTEYVLELRGSTGELLCDPWTLRTLPAPDAMPNRFRLLSYTCAGGPEIFVDTRLRPVFRPLRVRRRMLARALSFAPDAVIANGDHVYWALRSRVGWAMGRSPQAGWTAGHFDRSLAVLGTKNEQVLTHAFGPQIGELYGTLFRTVPTYFLQDDHDYSENDEVSEQQRTFPPDRFMLDVARSTQRLYYAELLADPTLPAERRAAIPNPRNRRMAPARGGERLQPARLHVRRRPAGLLPLDARDGRGGNRPARALLGAGAASARLSPTAFGPSSARRGSAQAAPTEETCEAHPQELWQWRTPAR